MTSRGTGRLKWAPALTGHVRRSYWRRRKVPSAVLTTCRRPGLPAARGPDAQPTSSRGGQSSAPERLGRLLRNGDVTDADAHVKAWSDFKCLWQPGSGAFLPQTRELAGAANLNDSHKFESAGPPVSRTTINDDCPPQPGPLYQTPMPARRAGPGPASRNSDRPERSSSPGNTFLFLLCPHYLIPTAQ